MEEKSISTVFATLIVSAMLALVALNASAQTYSQASVTVNGTKRTMMVYIPKDLPDNAPCIITMHGMGGDGDAQKGCTGWNDLADTARVAIVYPDGLNKAWDIGGMNDVNFVLKIISYMKTNYRINTGRVYASGFSMGGMFTYHLISNTTNKFAAFAPVSGFPVDNRNPSGKKHVPIIHHHGNKDDIVKFGGDPNHVAGGYRPVTDYVTAWAKWDGCDMENPVVKKTSQNDIMTTWKNEKEGLEVQYNILDGAYHAHTNKGNGGIHTTREIWNFVRRYSLNGDFTYHPTLSKVAPKEGSNTITPSSTFTIAFTDYVQVAPVTATFEGQGQTIEMVEQLSSEKSKYVKFAFPEGTQLAAGEYKLHVRDIINSKDGGRKDEMVFTYSVDASTGISAIATDDVQSAMYSLNGHRIATAMPYNIYVRDGHKVLIRE